jgi:Zn-finger nucleic acid-binding protein
MIRFACPGCGATYSVDDAKGGKPGRCPKCQTQFQIPAPDGAPAPPVTAGDSRVSLPPPPPPDPNAPVEIAPCPGCHARLSVAVTDLGVDVECPYCKTVYSAVRADKPPTSSKVRVAPVADDRPSRRRRDEDEEDEEYEDERPRRRRRRTASEAGTGMATASLVLGILSLPLAFCCGLLSLPISVLGIIFGVLGMKTEGRGMAMTGLVLSGLGIVMSIIMMVVGLAFNLANIGGGRNNFGPGPNNNPPPWKQPQQPQQPPFRR